MTTPIDFLNEANQAYTTLSKLSTTHNMYLKVANSFILNFKNALKEAEQTENNSFFEGENAKLILQLQKNLTGVGDNLPDENLKKAITEIASIISNCITNNSPIFQEKMAKVEAEFKPKITRHITVNEVKILYKKNELDSEPVSFRPDKAADGRERLKDLIVGRLAKNGIDIGDIVVENNGTNGYNVTLHLQFVKELNSLFTDTKQSTLKP